MPVIDALPSLDADLCPKKWLSKRYFYSMPDGKALYISRLRMRTLVRPHNLHECEPWSDPITFSKPTKARLGPRARHAELRLQPRWRLFGALEPALAGEYGDTVLGNV